MHCLACNNDEIAEKKNNIQIKYLKKKKRKKLYQAIQTK